MRVGDIRPVDVMSEQKAAVERDRAWLLKHEGRFVQVGCPACGGLIHREKFTKGGFQYVLCFECATMFINPRPPRELLVEFYQRSENYRHWSDKIFPASEQNRRVMIDRPRVAWLRGICARKLPTGAAIQKNVVVIGAGYGSILSELKSCGWVSEVLAVEPVASLAAACRERGVVTIEMMLEDATEEVTRLGGNGVSILAAFEVIEHVFSPREFLEACWRIMPVGGILALTCPNIQGFDIATLGMLSGTFTHEHLNYFRPRSLAKLVSDCGFDVIEVSTPGRLDAEIVRLAVLDGMFDISESPFLQRVLIDEWDRLGRPFQRFLMQNQLSSHMRLAATKIEP